MLKTCLLAIAFASFGAMLVVGAIAFDVVPVNWPGKHQVCLDIN